MRIDSWGKLMTKRSKPERPPATFWTPWGPQKASERDAQMAALKRLFWKIDKIRQAGKRPVAAR